MLCVSQFELADRAKVIELTITAPTEAGEFAGVLIEHFSTSAVSAAAPRCSTACGCQGDAVTAPEPS